MLVVTLAAHWNPNVAAAQSFEGDWMIQNLRPTGQPVFPVFDGWISRPDGTYDLCFGYFNMNTKQVFEIPLGEYNRIEPAQYHGLQPTHFREVPSQYRRYYCLFTVNVPNNFGDQSVVWTLTIDGKEYSVPGRLTSSPYMLEDMVQPSRGTVAPVLRFISPQGGEGRGTHGVDGGAAIVRVGSPLELSVEVGEPEGFEPRNWLVLWGKFSGSPGQVAFAEKEIVVRDGANIATTTATFSEAGEYRLYVQAVSGGRNSFGFHCCWTNGYVSVNVIP